MSPDTYVVCGGVVTNNGRAFVDRLIDSLNWHSRILFNANPSRFLAIGLARIGSHETGHFLLQQNTDSPSFFGVMRDSFNGTQWFGGSNETKGLWTFSSDQRSQIRGRLCPQEYKSPVNRNSRESDY